MIVHLYAVCWNEMAMLGFFFRHYERWVDRFVIYDDDSDDGSVAYLRSRPNVELRRFPYSDPDSFVRSHQRLHDTCWRESRGVADWVIVTAIDEHIEHPRMRHYLASCKRRGVTYLPALGFSMVTETFPEPHEHLARTRTFGVPDKDFNKLRVFDPDAIENPRFRPGGHRSHPEGRRMLPDRDELLLLHYKDLGLDYVIARAAALNARLRRTDREKQWGYQYAWPREEYAARHRHLTAGRIDVKARGFVPWRDHKEPRWWRPAPPGEEVAPMSPLQRLLDRLRPPYFG
jgi:hypothetical protein